jgi:hypothetical protein
MASAVGALMAMLGTVGPLGTVPAVAQVAVEPEADISVWNAPSSMDGVGSWLATVNDPAAGPGQALPAYAYLHFFYFENSDAFGFISLDVDGGQKSATFAIYNPADDTFVGNTVPFNWTAGRLYFPLVYGLGHGTWGGWVYDHAAASWTFIDGETVPLTWGKLRGVSATSVMWVGDPLSSCSAFPLADVMRYPPYGFVGGTIATSLAWTVDTIPGDCPVETSAQEGWVRYRVGAGATPAA